MYVDFSANLRRCFFIFLAPNDTHIFVIYAASYFDCELLVAHPLTPLLRPLLIFSASGGDSGVDDHDSAKSEPARAAPSTRKKKKESTRKRTTSSGSANGGAGGEQKLEIRPGDWICPDVGCSNLNFASRLVCGRFKCRVTRPGVNPAVARANPNMMRNNGNSAAKQYEFRSGDWVCPQTNCQNHNFASRDVCRMCHERKPAQKDSDGGEGAASHTHVPTGSDESNPYFAQMAQYTNYPQSCYDYSGGMPYYSVYPPQEYGGYQPQAYMAYYQPPFMMHNGYLSQAPQAPQAQQQAPPQYHASQDTQGDLPE